MKNVFSLFKEKLGASRWLLLLGALGILLLLIAPSFTETERAEHSLAEAEEYRKTLTLEVEALCETVRGAGDCTVLLTLAGGEYAVYEKNESASGSTVAAVGGEALRVGYEMPRVTGVAVVAEGGDSDEVRYALSTLLSSALGISSARISIAASY